MNADDCNIILHILNCNQYYTKLLYGDLFYIIIYNLLYYQNFDPPKEGKNSKTCTRPSRRGSWFLLVHIFFGRHFGCYFSFPFKTHFHISTYYSSCFIIYYYVKCLSYLQGNLLRYLRADRKPFAKVFDDARAHVHTAKRY